MAETRSGSGSMTKTLSEVLGKFVAAKAADLAGKLSEKVESMTGKLEDAADSGGLLSGSGGTAAKKLAEGASPAKAALSAVGTGLKDKVKSLFGEGGKGGGSGPKMTSIIEGIDIGAPLSEVYGQWTQFKVFLLVHQGCGGR